MASQPALSLRGLCKRYGALVVTDDLSLDVQAGTIHAIIGPNGAGKTSLLNQIFGSVAPDAGSVWLDGQDITDLPIHRRARLGLIRSFQIVSILPEFSVLENVALAAQARTGSSFRFFRAAAREASLNDVARAALAKVGLAAMETAIAGGRGHGEKRQLELAIALAAQPGLLLLDEPLAGAGVEEAARLIGILRALAGECTIVLVEHDMDAVFALADTVTVLAEGRILASGTPAEIRQDAAVRAVYLGDAC